MRDIILTFDNSPCFLPILHTRDGQDDIYTIDPTPLATPGKEGQRWLDIKLQMFAAQAGDPGYYMLPYSNKACFLTNFTHRENAELDCATLMPMFGAKFSDRAVLAVVEGMRYSYVLRLSIQDCKYSLTMRYNLFAYQYEPIRLRIITLPGSNRTYVDMAKAYRSIVVQEKKLIPLAQRAKNEPVISYAADAMPIIRIRMAWKPAPSPVPEQTLATEPAMHVACTFRDVMLLMEEMKRQGIEKAELCLVGWNVRGHDGRWPQTFPVEAALGGEVGLKQLTARARELGYRIVAHTNSSDAYHIADCWSKEDIIKTRDGSLSRNASWSGGQMYNLCPRVSLEKHLPRDLPHLRELGFGGFHYVDVLSIVPPRPCYDPVHPLNPEESAACTRKLMQTLRESFGGVGSEGAYDFCAEAMDFALYVGFHTLSGHPKIADQIIPLWQLVYHGYLFSNPSTETVNFMLKNQENRLRFYEFGGIPVCYFYTCFVNDADGSPGNWMGSEDLFCHTAEQRTQAVATIKAMIEDYRPYAQRQLAFMEDHRQLSPGVYETVYSDGWHVAVNFSDADFDLQGKTVPAKGKITWQNGIQN